LEVGEFKEVGFGEEEGVEPVYATLVAVLRLVAVQMYVSDGLAHTLFVDNLMLIFVLTPCLIYVGTRDLGSELPEAHSVLKAPSCSQSKYYSATDSRYSSANVR
jgi:hypothetical protein